MDTKPTSRMDPGVVALGWVSFLSDVASDMIYPLLPDFLTRTLHAGPAALGLIEGIAEATASLMKAASGWWSDRVRKRKPIVVVGYSIAAVARPLIGLASGWTQVLAIRFADRVGKGIRTSPRDALLADLVPPEDRGRAYGLQRAMDNAGAVAWAAARGAAPEVCLRGRALRLPARGDSRGHRRPRAPGESAGSAPARPGLSGGPVRGAPSSPPILDRPSRSSSSSPSPARPTPFCF